MLKLLIVLCTLSFLSACTSFNGGEQNPVAVADEPTSTEVAPSPTPTSTDTSEPTATPTELPEVTQELPLSWFEQNSLLELAKEADPNVSWTTAECIGYEGEECLTSVNLDPNGDGTAWLTAIPLVMWNPEEYRTTWLASHFGYEGEYTLIIWTGLEGFQHSGELILSKEGWEQLFCMYWPAGTPRYPVGQQNLFVLPLSKLVYEWHASTEMLAVIHVTEQNPVTQCGDF